MASISANTFEFVRQLGENGLVQMRTTREPRRIYYINTYSSEATRHRPGPTRGRSPQIRLPRKMAKALLHACILFDRDNQHMRQIWRPRWPV